LDINGFDERYLAPGIGEDSDISVRLRWNGIKVHSIKTSAIQYHMYHRLLERSAVNDQIYDEVIRQHLPFTPYGIIRQSTSPQSSDQA
jgi:hypothetical protein